jgi:hypothetical protein
MRIEIMSRRGDEVFAEWNTETPAAELQAIAERFAAIQRRGYRAFGSVSGTRVDAFDANVAEDLVFIAPVVGG